MIENLSINKKKFIQCSNTNCQLVFPFMSLEKSTEANFLCPNCHTKLNTHHIVQCINCESIINFLEVEDGEIPSVFLVNKCHHCFGSIEDECRIQPFIYPELFI